MPAWSPSFLYTNSGVKTGPGLLEGPVWDAHRLLDLAATVQLLLWDPILRFCCTKLSICGETWSKPLHSVTLGCLQNLSCV